MASPLFEELDYRPTPIGAISLRRRRILSIDKDVLEILLGEEHLMSDLFTASEIALARLGMAETIGPACDVVVGGLGLGFTAKAVLEAPQTGSLMVVEMLAPVIEWHQNGLIPLGKQLSADPRCQLIEGDFFALAASDDGFDTQNPGRKFHAILVDIDHSPDALLDPRSSSFYGPEGLKSVHRHLHPGGVFGLWSDAQADPVFVKKLEQVFESATAEPVTFDNPFQRNTVTQTVYLARRSK